ncbi:MAG: histidinol-phosphatase HisJ family protein [candidate division Zixibacteria bacterium]|nr:histidinol-phosphatase HisJ family protein [candidate division Zixibacteria bacterium]
MRDNFMNLADYHIHPDFSFDAKGSIDEFCVAAIKKGLTEICFTTHYDTDSRFPENHRKIRINGELVPNSIENIGAYVKAVAKAADKYIGHELLVQCGLEVGYYPGCEDEIKKLFNKYEFHYKIGSVHLVGGFNICNKKSMQGAPLKYDLNQFADLVFEDLIKSAESGLFNVLGHIDMYKKHGLKVYGDKINTVHEGRIDKLFQAMNEHGCGLEINTSSIREGFTEYYPSMAIINAARSAGVRIVAVGSDAHKPEEIACDFEGATTVAYELLPYRGE